MTATVGAKAEVTAYLDQVRAQLDDLPEPERDDLLEDLEQHLCEVSVEVDAPLAVRLGPPELYAAELRQSAGLPPRGTAPAGRVAKALAAVGRSGLVRLARTAWGHPSVEAGRRFASEARPGWWVGRGLLLLGSWVVLYANPSLSDLPVPRVAGSQVLTLALTGFAVWGSVWLGRRSDVDRGARWASVGLNVLVLVLGFNALDQVAGRMDYRYVYGTQSSPYLAHPDGSPITDIRPYALDGSPLDGVLLYDQDGRPITNVDGPHVHAPTPDGKVYENRFPVQKQPSRWCVESPVQPQMCSPDAAEQSDPPPPAVP